MTYFVLTINSHKDGQLGLVTLYAFCGFGNQIFWTKKRPSFSPPVLCAQSLVKCASDVSKNLLFNLLVWYSVYFGLKLI